MEFCVADMCANVQGKTSELAVFAAFWGLKGQDFATFCASSELRNSRSRRFCNFIYRCIIAFYEKIFVARHYNNSYYSCFLKGIILPLPLFL